MECFEQSNKTTYANAKYIKKLYPTKPKDIEDEVRMAINLANTDYYKINTNFMSEKDQKKLIKIINDWIETLEDKGGY